MTYLLKIFTAEDVSDTQRESAANRFRFALEQSLGHESLVWPCYGAYMKLFQLHGDHIRPWPVSDAEQVLIEQWEAAELAATQAAFGSERYLGDADYEITAKISRI